MKIKEIIRSLENWAPPSYQESYDNSGLIVGDDSEEITGILIALDTTEKVIEEAITQQCNLVIAHHPIVFKGLKRLTGRNYVERTIIKAIKNNIAVYAIHTNLDSVMDGVNKKIGEKLKLKNLKILSPKKDLLVKLTTFVPDDHLNKVLEALYNAGAGQIGNYDHCSFQTDGIGTFRPGDASNPHIGSKNQDETVREKKIEVILSSHRQGSILEALEQAHPYEEVAYYLHPLNNSNQEVGAGMIGEINPTNASQFLKDLKKKMSLSCIRHTALVNENIKKVAICGGAGSFLLGAAIAKRADIFITADFKYHEFFDAEEKIIIADIGHYESEIFTKELIYEFLKEKFANIALHLSKVNTNPIKYL